MTLLNCYTTTNQRKNKTKDEMKSEYIRCFKEGFIYLINDLPDWENYKDNLFENFISLSFAPNQVIKILNKDNNSLADKQQVSKSKKVSLKRDLSKKGLKRNNAFILICKKINSYCDNHNIQLNLRNSLLLEFFIN